MEGSLIETSDHFNLVEGWSDIKEEAEDVLEELNLSGKRNYGGSVSFCYLVGV